MLSDDKLLTLAQENSSSAVCLDDGDLFDAIDRAQAYYYGVMDDMEPLEDMSTVVSRDVFETVESLLPEIVDIFLSGDEVMEFRPVGSEDEKAAAQETDVVNHVVLEQNPGYALVYGFAKDGLLNRLGITKVRYEKNEDIEEERFTDVAEEELDAAELMGAEIKSRRMLQNGLYSATNVTRRDRSKVVIENVPFHEFAYSARGKVTDIQRCPYFRHRRMIARSDLIEAGYDKDTVKKLPQSGPETLKANPAQRYDRNRQSAGSSDPALQEIEVTEHYMLVDADEDGVSERWVITEANGTLLDKQRIDRWPFAVWTPYISTNEMAGLSLADLVSDIQRIKTQLWRNALNNASLMSNQRPIVNTGMLSDDTMEDILVVRDGAPIRVNGSVREALTMMPNSDLSGAMLGLIEHTDVTKENRTGITRNSQGLDPDTLNKAATTATGVSALMTASMKRIRLLAKTFAETGMKDLMLNVHWMLRKHQDQEMTIRLRNEWVDVDPSSWHDRYDMTVDVGIGTGSKQSQLAALNNILNLQLQGIQLEGGSDGMVSRENIFNSVSKIIELSGFKQAEKYVTSPDKVAPQQQEQAPPDPAIVKAQLDAENDRIKIISDAELRKYQIDNEIELKAQFGGVEFILKDKELKAKIESMRAGAITKAASVALKTDVGVGGDPG